LKKFAVSNKGCIFVSDLKTNTMTTQQTINEILKTGSKKTETFNGISVLEIEARISVKQSLEFCSFLSSIANNKGRNDGTINGKTLSIISDWYDVNGGSITINHIYGKSVSNKTSYYTIVWNKEL
jgi:hypothetical protein